MITLEEAQKKITDAEQAIASILNDVAASAPWRELSVTTSVVSCQQHGRRTPDGLVVSVTIHAEL